MKKRIYTMVEKVKAFWYGFYPGLVFSVAFILLIAEPIDGNVFNLTFLSIKVGAFTLMWHFINIMNKREKQTSNEKVE